MPNDERGLPVAAYDLEERTAVFGESIIDFGKSIPKNAITDVLVGQVVRCGTSVGANYCEADDAGSKKEFRYRISVAKRESRETKFFIRMIVRAEPSLADAGRVLWQEAKELNLIFGAILRSTPRRSRERAERK